MDIMFFLKGLVIGVAMAIPIGPIGILCIRKTLTNGHTRGMVVGLGAATADSLYAGIAAFGLTIVSDLIASQTFWLRLVGGGFLLFLGIRTLYLKHKESEVPPVRRGFMGSYVSSFVLALTNPMTIFAFVIVFAAFGLEEQLNFFSAGILVVGVFTGSCLWFLGLSYSASLFRKKLNSGGLTWVNRISGGLIIVSGIAAFISIM